METMQFDDLDNALLSLMAQLRERMVARTDLSTSMEGQIAYAVVRAIQISPDIAPNDKLAAVNYVSKVLVIEGGPNSGWSIDPRLTPLQVTVPLAPVKGAFLIPAQIFPNIG